MLTNIVERRINEVKKQIGINSYRAASGSLDPNQIGMLTRREMKAALFLIRLKQLEDEKSMDKVGTVTKYTIGE